MANYSESKKNIDKIRNNYGETLFRMGISHMMDVGMRHLTEEIVNATCESIMKEDDSEAFMTNEYKCYIVRCASELAQIDHIHLLVYISKNVKYCV